jgi:hypothetical protein
MSQDDPFRCECQRTLLCRREYAGGTRHVVYQCLDCGRQVRSVPKAEYLGRVTPGNLPPWDEGIPRRWSERRNRHWQQHYEARRAEEQDEWNRRYDEHINSDKWRDLRRRVLARAKGTCEGCGQAPAAHVHHLTYKRLGAEMLFDLAAVCLDCHESIHGRPIGED